MRLKSYVIMGNSDSLAFVLVPDDTCGDDSVMTIPKFKNFQNFKFALLTLRTLLFAM